MRGAAAPEQRAGGAVRLSLNDAIKDLVLRDLPPSHDEDDGGEAPSSPSKTTKTRAKWRKRRDRRDRHEGSGMRVSPRRCDTSMRSTETSR
jgi:hypothetical protein